MRGDWDSPPRPGLRDPRPVLGRGYPVTGGDPGRDRPAGEGPPGYDTPAHRPYTAGADTGATDGVLDRLLGAVAAVRDRPIDELTERQLVDEVTRLELAMRRLDARISRTTAAVRDRHAPRARQAAAGADDRGSRRAEARTRRQAAPGHAAISNPDGIVGSPDRP
jgi:hypothetical protein